MAGGDRVGRSYVSKLIFLCILALIVGLGAPVPVSAWERTTWQVQRADVVGLLHDFGKPAPVAKLSGAVMAVNAPERSLLLQTEQGQTWIYLADDALVFREGTNVSFESLRPITAEDFQWAVVWLDAQGMAAAVEAAYALFEVEVDAFDPLAGLLTVHLLDGEPEPRHFSVSADGSRLAPGTPLLLVVDVEGILRKVIRP